jgi:hypothetical protein
MQTRALPGILVLAIAALLGPVTACSSSSTTGGATASDGGGDTDGAITDAGGGGGTMCTSARTQLLAPLAKTSKGVVSVASTSGATKVLYVDASAGGVNGGATNPRIYVNLDTASRVDLTDTAAFTSADWDLALKRTTIYSNSGDAGIGMGGAAQINKAFAAVTAADASAVKAESFFDDQCMAKTDPIGGPLSAFSDWYDYDQATNIPTPKPNVTYVVRGGTGKLFKVAITSYTGLPDGGMGSSTGYFLLEVAAL